MRMATNSMDVSDYTSIRVSKDLADELHDKKARGESYEDVIRCLAEKAEKYDEEANDG